MRAALLRVFLLVLAAAIAGQAFLAFFASRPPPSEIVALRQVLAFHQCHAAAALLTAAPGPPPTLAALSHGLGAHLERVPAGQGCATLPDGLGLQATPRLGPPALPLLPFLVQVCGSLATLAIALLLLERRFFRDLSRLSAAATRMAAGDLQARATVPHGPVAPLAAAFDGMAAQIEAQLSSERHMLAAVSHDLRTPLARMQFRLSALPISESERAALEEDLEEMEYRLAELLTVTRLANAPLEAAEPEATESVLNRAIARAQALRPDLPIQLQLRGNVPMSARDLSRVADNLLTNALRHARSQVLLAVDPDGGLLVEDDGPGVPVELRARIFAPFVSGDEARNGQTGGVGLGLTIVARAARRWGGAVRLEEPPGGGARFVVHFEQAADHGRQGR
jgi:signal transduction histidine kinase